MVHCAVGKTSSRGTFPPQQRLQERASMLRYTRSTLPILLNCVILNCIRVRTVYRDRQYVRNYRSVHCTGGVRGGAVG
jgi:hypothetical protein